MPQLQTAFVLLYIPTKILSLKTFFLAYIYVNIQTFFSECRNLGGSIDNAATNQLDVGVVADASACSTACSANADCQLWVFYTATYIIPAQAFQCFLKWNTGFSYSLPPGSTISALRGCP